MADPFHTKKSLEESIEYCKTFDFFAMVYPTQIMESCLEAFNHKGSIVPPKTVFKPSKSVLRKMIRAIVEYGDDTESKFMMRFGLVID